jgi:hypothetical protein
MNRLDTLPREILFEIIDRLSLRDVSRMTIALNLCERSVDYICARTHRRDFSLTLAEIDTIKYDVCISTYGDMPCVKSTSSYRGITTLYEYCEHFLILKSYSTKSRPIKLIPNQGVGLSNYEHIYEKAYTFDLEKGIYHMLRLITITEYKVDRIARIKFSFVNFKANTVDGCYVRYFSSA